MKENINVSVPRPEFPDPQLRRENWLNLNGEWEFEIDLTGEKNSYSERTFQTEHFSKKIIVPFAPESDLIPRVRAALRLPPPLRSAAKPWEREP